MSFWCILFILWDFFTFWHKIFKPQPVLSSPGISHFFRESWFLSVDSGASEPRSGARCVCYCWGVAAAGPFQWVNTNVDTLYKVFCDMLFKVSAVPGDLYVQTWKVCPFFWPVFQSVEYRPKKRTIFYWWTSRLFSVFCPTVNVESVNHISVNTTNVSVSLSPWKEISEPKSNFKWTVLPNCPHFQEALSVCAPSIDVWDCLSPLNSTNSDEYKSW